MLQSWPKKHRRRVVLAACATAAALIVAQAPSVAPAAHAAVSAAKKPGSKKSGPSKLKFTLCAWSRAAIGQQRFGNTGFIDTNALYLLTTFGYFSGPSLRIHGLFPHARYFSYTLYAGRSGVLIDHLTDASIAPDPGNTNPFQTNANRDAAKRAYTIYIVQGAPPVRGRAPNTLYTGPYHPVLIMYRIYAPDQGADDYGSVPKPEITHLNGSPDTYSKADLEPQCATPQPARSAPNLDIRTPLIWQRYGSLGSSGVNADDAYLQMRLNHDDHDVYVIRFKAPTYEDTYDGKSITGHANVRYWSLCQYDMASTRVVACIHDYEAIKSRSGYVTVVVSTFANKPATATAANGVNWLPFGPEQVGVLIYRQLLPNPRFEGSIVNVAPDAYQFEIQQDMGRYLPVVSYCATANYTPQSCTDQINAQFCSDLTEPAPCGASLGENRLASNRPGGQGATPVGTETR